ncbi:hypothetical protein SG26_03215 [Haloarcula sp. CBA1115]|uniref:hypothetical protein n=1 Tax=unclassified Haloarcula TaxID=2624677 RepID=UPI0005955BF1|nr:MULTISPECIES: hypothetical protein [unclassified Haloarcula]AJF24786.1 hypothetical protein SG26_03215 [Haloarcula sp. CBA1115]
MELTVDLDDDVYERLESRAKRHEFDTPAEYATVMITTVLDELEGKEDDNVRDRLEDLGYL